jgi:spermidine/putrescine ABC transporter ATP-binding subunit
MTTSVQLSASSAARKSLDIGEPGRLRIEGVAHEYGPVSVLRGIDLDIRPGEFLTLLGPSGSGKTTLLRIIGGLIVPLRGRVWLGDHDITDLPPEKRDIGFVFQNYALFPHLTVAENVGFALKVRRQPALEIAKQVEDVLGLVGLADFGHRYPAQLSGGQQQRVALARAIVFRPAVLLLDEPLGALDRQLRQQLGLELRELQRRSGITMVYVTHDQEEAFTMSTRVAIMNHGSMLQIGAPQAIYRRPVSLFVARFVGDLNLFHGSVMSSSGGRVAIETADGIILQASTHIGYPLGERVQCVLRPEHLRIGKVRPGEALALRARVKTVIFGGSWHRLELALLSSGKIIWAEGRSEPAGVLEGAEVSVTYDPDSPLLFPSDPNDRD